MSDSFRDALAGLAAIVGDKQIIASGSDQEPYVVDRRGLMRGIKQLLDPHGLMNPGKIFGAGAA